MHAHPAAVATLIHQILTDRGPLEDGELYDELVAAQAPMGDDPEQLFNDLILSDELGPVTILSDGRYCWLPAVLQGRVFTHRVDEREIEHDLLALTPDLDAVSMIAEGPDAFRLGGAPLPFIFPGWAELPDDRKIPPHVISPDGDVVLPVGTLSKLGVQPDDVIGLRVNANDLAIERVEELAVPPRSLPSELLSLLDDDDFEAVDIVVPTLCALDEDLFRQPLPPFSELLDSMGFAWEGDRVAVPGFDFEAAFLANRISLLQERHGLDEDEAAAVAQFVALFDDVARLTDQMSTADVAAPGALAPDAADEPDDESHYDEVEAIHEILQYLTDPDLASVVLHQTLTTGSGNPAALLALTSALEPQAPRAARAPLRWLQAKAYEQLGDLDAAEEALDQAEGLDPNWPLTLLDLSGYASDRGDATRALSLLRRAGADDGAPFVMALRRYQPVPRPDMRRNAPCWCGSGRKYKACHLNNEQLPLSERAGWLYAKADDHLRTADWPALLIDLAEFRMREDSSEAYVEALFDPFVRDVVLAEGGAFQDYFERRSRLLPEDERELAEQWLPVKRSMYEVVDVRPGQGMTLQDVVSKERCDVEHQETSDIRVDSLVCARPLPVEGALRCFGGLEPVPRSRLDAVLDAMREQDPSALIEAVSG